MTSRRALTAGMAAVLAGLGPLAVAGPSLARDSLTADNGVAAKVNGEAISTYDLVQRMRLLVILSGLKPEENTVAWLQRYATTSLINERLKTQEFERYRRLSELDGDIAEQIKAMGGGDTVRLLGTLEQSGVQADSLRAWLRGQIAWAALVHGRLGGRVQVSDEMAAQEAARLSAPDTAKVRLGGLFISDPSSGDRATGLAMAAELVRQVQAGANLEGLASAFSDPSPYAAGGQGRWILVDSLDTEVAAAIVDAPLGLVAKPVETRDGVLLLVVLERYQPGGAAPTITTETAAAQLGGDRLASLASRYLRDLKSSAEISP